MRQSKKPAAWVESIIKKFIQESPENTLQNQANEKAFEDVLVGFSRGDDPLFTAYKEHVGDFHWTPSEAFNLAFPEERANPEDLAVISWILPQTAATKADNRKMDVYPAERWARARIFGEEVNAKLRKHVVQVFKENGYQAVAPSLLPDWSMKQSDKYVFASTWSERHAAYASGLGTFGLCDGLITPLGKAMRTGSVIARIKITPTQRPYQLHREYCLFYSKGICGKCIPRCPVGALSEKGHDKVKCRAHVRPATEEYVKANYGFDGYGCGLCQTGVPCESKIPKKEDVRA
jgi:epoxyqueuosine reductase